MEVNRTWIFERLKHALQLLACSSEIQLGKFPSFVHTPDELALDYDHFRSACIDNFRSELTDEQISRLAAIDQLFLKIPKDSFSPEAVTKSPAWQQVRLLAAEALKAFDWPIEDPPSHNHEFVRA